MRPTYTRLPTDAAASTPLSNSSSSSSSDGNFINGPSPTSSSSPRPFQRFKRLLVIATGLVLFSAFAIQGRLVFEGGTHQAYSNNAEKTAAGAIFGIADFKKWASSTKNGIAKVFGSSSTLESDIAPFSPHQDQHRITLVAMW